MKYLKYFEFKNNIKFSINNYTGLFEIDNDEYCIEIVQEDMLAIKEILIDKSYNTYICDPLEIYLCDNILTICLSDMIINIDKKDFNKLIKNIDKYYKRVSDYESFVGDKYENSNFSKTIVDDFVRVSKKYNL